MTDPEVPDFNVVDRRSSMPEPPTHSSGEADSAEATSASPSDPSAGAHSQDAEPSAFAEGSELSDADLRMPDPAMMLSFAAMQMEPAPLVRALIAVFDGHAWRAMGLITDPVSGETKRDLPAAQLAIDCIQFLVGKVDSGISENEQRELQRRMNDLRMNYLLKVREG